MTDEELKALRESLQNRSIHYRETSAVVAIIDAALESMRDAVYCRHEWIARIDQCIALTRERDNARAAAIDEVARWLEQQRWVHGDSGDTSKLRALAKLPATMVVVERETLMEVKAAALDLIEEGPCLDTRPVLNCRVCMLRTALALLEKVTQ